jgi:hypothetical protein
MNVAEIKVTAYDLDQLVARWKAVLFFRALGIGVILAAIVEVSFLVWELTTGI